MTAGGPRAFAGGTVGAVDVLELGVSDVFAVLCVVTVVRRRRFEVRPRRGTELQLGRRGLLGLAVVQGVVAVSALLDALSG